MLYTRSLMASRYLALFSLASVLILSFANRCFAQAIYTTPYTVTTLAGQFTNGSGWVDGNAQTATFNAPQGVAVDSSGNVYVADGGNNVIRKVTPNGTTSTIAGQHGVTGNVNGNGTAATFGEIDGIAIDSSGNLYVTDVTYNTVRKITLNAGGWTVSTLVPSNAGLNYPLGLAVDSSGNVYVADCYNMVIRKVSPAGTMTTLAGTLGVLGAADGNGTSARFGAPAGIALDSTGNLYVTDTGSSTLRKITPTGTVTTLGGFFGEPGLIDGTLSNTAHQFAHLYGITSDSSGNLFITDGSSGTYIRKISAAGIVSTLAGSNTPGSGDGTGSTATLFNAKGIAVDSSGALYITNTASSTIRKAFAAVLNAPAQITANPSNTVGSVGFSVSLQVGATGSTPLNYQWYFNNKALSNSATVSGATTANLILSNFNSTAVGQYYVVVTNAYGSATSQTASVVLNTPAITSQPQSINVAANANTTLSVTATGTTPTYQWYLNNLAILGATSSTYTISSVQTSTAGSYTVTISNPYGSVTSNAALVTFGNNPGRLINLSVLTLDGPGSQLLTVGFVTGGSGTTGSQNLLIRATGPALISYGVTNVLPDPILTIFNGSNIIATNDNWSSTLSNQAAVTTADLTTSAFPLTDPTSLDAATVVSIPTNSGYTVQVAGKASASGNALTEIYDNTPPGTYSSTTPRLINISCLQQVAANSILTAGFTIGGATTETVLIRASGPALTLAGVAGAIPDPTLTVYSGSTVIASNAGWANSASNQTLVTSAEASTGAFAYTNTASHDAATVLTLQPGSYTVQAKSSSGTVGSTLIEIYEVSIH
ncbi:MAG: hypothetical protein DVB35_05235 [Verrucomicrobia bacterium]|nr:MAG: hypothetical protein DVB35_05235 [Verrucomicrobiota bacterium]